MQAPYRLQQQDCCQNAATNAAAHCETSARQHDVGSNYELQQLWEHAQAAMLDDQLDESSRLQPWQLQPEVIANQSANRVQAATTEARQLNGTTAQVFPVCVTASHI